MTSIVATLINDTADRVSFATALHRELKAQFCTDSMELRSLVTAGPVDAIVADLETARHASMWHVVRTIVDPHPAIPVLLWLSLTGKDMRDLVAIATETKPDAVIIREIDDASLIADAIRSARDGNATQRVMRAVERRMFERLQHAGLPTPRDLFEYLLGVVAPPLRGVTAADQHSPLADLGHFDKRLQCAWYESRGSRSL